METQTAQQEREIVWEFLDKASVKYRDSDANEKILLDACDRPVDFDSVARAFLKVQHQLAPTREYIDAYTGFFAARPDFARAEANVSLLDSLWDLEYQINVDGLIAIAEHKDVRDRLARTQEFHDQQADLEERARLIQEISEGKESYTWIREDGAHINYLTHGPEGLDQESTERLREIAALMESQRQALRMNSKDWLEQKRKENIRKAQEQAGMISIAKTLPATWTPSEDGTFSNTGPVIKKGVPVELNQTTFYRLSVTDIKKLVIQFGSDLVNEKLVGKKVQTFGNIQYVRN